ncbi:MAG: PAS domain-containing sensor histidine kinase [Ignavibacteriae bacterium]|nr:PAS domain-containing sensor histidine kinase [Ignavibacteriota bacterium]
MDKANDSAGINIVDKKNLPHYNPDFQEFIDFLPEGIYATNEEGKIVLANNAALKIFGYEKKDLERVNNVFDLIVPEEKEMMRKYREDLVLSKKPYKAEYHVKRKDGSVISVLIHTTPIIKDDKFSGTRGVVLDLTERKIIESGLKASNKFLDTTINAMQEPFFVKDENHKWVILNDASIKMWGHSKEELIGKSDYDIFPKEQADVFWEKDDYVFKKGYNTNIEEITDSSGEIRTIITSKVRYTDKSTGKKYIVGTIHDITDIRKAENKLKEYSLELEELNRNKDKFFSIIAHDLRNPFTGIFGFASVLNEDLDNLSKEEIKEYVNYIYVGTKNIFDLIENLLAWSRIQTGKISILPEKIDIHKKVQEMVDILNATALNKRIEVQNNVEKDLFVMGDVFMLDSILQNLLSNAIKFTNAGGNVKICSESKNGLIEISISDNGIGISQEEIENLFRLGRQRSKSGTAEEKGTGLGLILCQEMINKLNGQLKVESVKNHGSTFSFTLPEAV